MMRSRGIIASIPSAQVQAAIYGFDTFQFALFAAGAQSASAAGGAVRS